MRTDEFLELSAALTGFSRGSLLDTGMADDYLAALSESLPEGVVDELLDADRSQLLDDPKLGPAARNLIVLWYCGTWTQMPEQWRSDHGSAAREETRVISAMSYQSGLQWLAVGAHPVAARPQGYAAWAFPPEELVG